MTGLGRTVTTRARSASEGEQGRAANSRLIPLLALRASIRLAGCLTLFFFTGCHGDIAPVSGRVTLNGQPLKEAVVTFQPHGDRDSRRPAATGSVGHTDSQGRYTLRLIKPDRPGAVIGEHTVTISTATGGSDNVPAKGQRLPRAWRDGSKRFTVPAGGTAEANFEIRQ
jgi:hypothetical protein